MVTTKPIIPWNGCLASTKRKSPADVHLPLAKKQRVAGSDIPAANMADTRDSMLVKLGLRYSVKSMSVLSGTKIHGHVDKALEHLGRFSAWDQTVLPGIVHLHAKAGACSKLITISELVRRRIGEGVQKWYQYNVLGEADVMAARRADLSMVEDTQSRPNIRDEVVERGGDSVTIRPTIFEQAVNARTTRHQAIMTILISRVPVEELKMLRNIALQTNKDYIDQEHRKKDCMVG